ncbi:hypothetical protein [Streptomyces sp. NPDC126499]|uniref:hypothetical protein n=1 Tax=Streptomyces sp. NPDC126499 TaxID=3155314 RepID=UPI003320701E
MTATTVNYVCGQCGTTTRHSCPAVWPTPSAARQATAQPAADERCGCGHAAHAPGTECEDGVNHGSKRWHRCLCLNLVGANAACPPDMDCQGGRLGYSDVWHLQRAVGRQDTQTATEPPNDMPQLFALQRAITESGGTLTREVHTAIDALRNFWDAALQRAQQPAAGAES